jgi:hypothetical protein
MNRTLHRLWLGAAVAAVGLLLGWGRGSSAQQESSLLVSESGAQAAAAAEPQMIPAMPTTPMPTTPVPMPAPLPGPAAGAVPQEELNPPTNSVTIHPVARIDYDVTHRARRLFGGSPFIQLSMVTQNPADGCFYEIPLCLPACCTGEPKMTSYCGLFGRGVVKYCYECGLEVEVKFRLRGDVEVEYGT